MTPPCMHCGEEFDQHDIRGNARERWCRDGQHRFNFEFQQGTHRDVDRARDDKEETMIYGEHLNADEQEIKCVCGVTATVEVIDKHGCSYGWFCRRCAERKRSDLKRQAKLATAIVRKGVL